MALPERARLRVKKGPVWPGGMVAVALRLDGDQMAIEVTEEGLGRGERGTVKRLYGEEGLAEIDAGRRPVFRFPVAAAKLSFSDAPGKRTLIGVELDGKPKFALLFLDFSPVEDVALGKPGAVLRSTAEVMMRGGGDARTARELWREALSEMATGSRAPAA